MPEMGAEGYPKDWEPSADAIAELEKAGKVSSGLMAPAGD
jgi:hypothetical protein